MIKAVIFDFDGTLADTKEVFFECYPQVAHKYGFKVLPREELEKLKRVSIRARLKAVGVPIRKIPALVREAREMSEEYMDSCPTYPGIPEVVGDLVARGLLLAIVSSNASQNINRFLKAHNMELFAQVLTASGIFGKHRAIKKLLDECGLENEEALYVGDELRDIVSCRKVPLKVVSVTWGYDDPSLLRQGEPEFIVEHPREILECIEKLNS